MADPNIVNPYERIWKTRDLRALEAPIELENNTSQFRRGLNAFGKEMQATGYGLAALGAQGLENAIGENAVTSGITDWGVEGYKKAIDESQSGYNAPNVADVSNIKGVGDFTDWASYQLGKGLPMLGTLALSGGVGGAIGRLTAQEGVKQIAKGTIGSAVKKGIETKALQAAEGQIITKAMQETAAKALRDRAVAGAMTGGFAGSFGLEGGLAFGEQVGAGVKPEDAVKSAIAVGGINGALEFLPFYKVAKDIGMGQYAKKSIAEIIKNDAGLSKKAIALATTKELGGRAVKGGLEGVAAEGITEGLQELTSIAGLRWAKQDPLFAALSDDDWNRIGNAAVAGALVGGVAAGAGATLKGPEVTDNVPTNTNTTTSPAKTSTINPAVSDALRIMREKRIIAAIEAAHASGDTTTVDTLISSIKSRLDYLNEEKAKLGSSEIHDKATQNQEALLAQVQMLVQKPVLETPSNEQVQPVTEEQPVPGATETQAQPPLEIPAGPEGTNGVRKEGAGTETGLALGEVAQPQSDKSIQLKRGEEIVLTPDGTPVRATPTPEEVEALRQRMGPRPGKQTVQPIEDTANAQEVQAQTETPVKGTSPLYSKSIGEIKSPNEGVATEATMEEFEAVRRQFQERQSQTPFKKWFGTGTPNVTATKEGEPITLYHGTSNPAFFRWDSTKAGEASGHPTAGLGFFMTADPGAAARYGDRLLELHAKINNPYTLTDADLTRIETPQDAAQLRKRLMAKGYDGAVVTAPGASPYVIAFQANQIKLKSNTAPTDSPDMRYSKPLQGREASAPFYSALERAAQEVKQQKAPAGQWLGTLDTMVKKGIIRQEELDWSGTKEWLQEQKGQVTKEELLQHVRDNMLEVQETKFESDQTRNVNWTLPGGENQQELVLTIPSIEPFNTDDTTHYGDVGRGKAVAWVRFNDRVDEEGKKTLFIEEVQSKRHQEGKNKGYTTKEDIKKFEQLKESVDQRMEALGIEPGGWLADEEFARMPEDLRKDWKIVYEPFDTGDNLIPDAPFKQTIAGSGQTLSGWAGLAFKRMLRYAAENGYDKIAWTTGEQQAQRYNLTQEEGMKGFYDRLLPNEINKYVKKWGAKVEKTQMEFGDETADVHSIEVTPAMRDSVMQGQPLFSKETEKKLQQPSTTKVSLQDLQSNIDSIMGQGWLQRAQELGLVEVIEGAGPNNEAGSWAGDRIRLYTDTMPKNGSPAGVLLHEGKHVTFEDVLGNSLPEYVKDLHTLADNGNKVAQDAITHAAIAVADVLEIKHNLLEGGTKADLKNLRALIEQERPGLLTEEELAYFVQYGTDAQTGTGFWKRLINQIKAWFAQTRLGQRMKELGIGFEMTDAMAVEWAKMGLNRSLENLRQAEKARIQAEKQASTMPASARLGKVLEALESVDPLYSLLGQDALSQDVVISQNPSKAKELSISKDSELIARFEKEPKVKAYRAMQVIDGKLYPPMSAIVGNKLREPSEIGKWEKSVENPELAENGFFKLNKGNKSTIKARYNPYFHTSLSPLNDQFSSAYKRDNLVTVEVEIPESELTSGYKAENAKDSVGMMSWHSGPVSSKLKGEKARKVILTRYAKIIRIVPDSEVATTIAKLLENENISIPEKVITPSLRTELEKLGVKIDYNNVSGTKTSGEVLYSMGIQEIRDQLWNDPTDIRPEIVNKPGLLQKWRADFIDFFAEMEKKSKDIYDTYSLLRSKKAARVEQARQEYFLPLRKLIAESPWTAQEVGDMAAARHIKVDNVNTRLAQRASYGYTKELLKALSTTKRKELMQARINVKAGKMPDGSVYLDANGNPAQMSARTKQQLMFDLMNQYSQYEITGTDGIQVLREEWELFKDAAAGFSDGGVGSTKVRTVDNVLKAADKDRAKFNQIMTLFDAANRHTLELLEDGGLITAAEHARLLLDKSAYAPLRRESYKVDEEVARLFQRAGQGGSKQIATRSGTENLSEPTLVLQNALAAIEAAAAAAERNLANKELYKVVVKDQAGWKPWFTIVEKEKYVTHDEDGFLQEKNATASNRADITLINDGKKLVIRPNMHNERAMGFVRAVNNLDAQVVNGPMKVLGWLNQIVRWVNVSASPIFLMTNAFKDPFTALYNIQATEAEKYTKEIFSPKTYKDSFRALKKVFMDGNRDPNDPDVQWVERWELAGGRTSFVETLRNMDETWKSFDAQVSRRKGTVFGINVPSFKSLMQAKDKWIDGLENFNILFENVMRFSTFKVLMEKGAVSEAQAARISQDLTTNFTRRGYKAQALGTWWLFFNASVQGNYQVLRNLMSSKKVQAAVGGTVVMALLLDLLGRAVDDDWDKIPEWDKERFIILPIKVAGDFVRIPAPWVYNVVWRTGGLLGEMLSQVKTPQDGLLDIAAMVTTTFNPLGKPGSLAQAISPTGFDPFMQIIENKNFAGNPIGPEGFPGASKKANSELMWSSTPQGYQSFARFVNEATGGSAVESGAIDLKPGDYQILANFLTGSLGRFMSDATFGVKEALDKDFEGMRDIPVVKEFFSDPYDPLKSQKYHTNVAGIYGAHKLEQMYIKGPERDLIKLQEVRENREKELRMYSQAQDVERQLKSLRVRLRTAQNRGDTVREKELRDKIGKIQERFNNVYQQRMG